MTRLKPLELSDSPYFKEAEFRCKCGKCEGFPPEGISPVLIGLLTNIRKRYGYPIIIKSGYRCPDHNKAVGGAKASQHMYGRAADFVFKGVGVTNSFGPLALDYGDLPIGLAVNVSKDESMIDGIPKGFIHIDTRGQRARWSYNALGREYIDFLIKGGDAFAKVLA